ncbi:MAG: MFS transporter [Promethearchaeia archaeon]
MTERIETEKDEMLEKEELRTLEGAQLVGYSSGVLGQIIPATLINSYIFIFFTYVVGLNALLTSIGTALAAVANALGAPIFGYLIDKKEPGKFGKRRPFLLLCLPFICISLILLWYSPLAETFAAMNWGIAIYLWVLLIVFFASYAMLRSSYMSMQPEQSQVEENRIKIGSMIGIFSLIGTVLGIFLPLILQSQLENPNNIFSTPADRKFLLNALPFLGWFFAFLAIIFTLGAFFSTNEDFLHDMPKSEISQSQTSFKDVILNIGRPFQDRNFCFFLLSILLSSVGVRLLLKDLTLYLTFVLYLKESRFITFILPMVLFAVLGFIVWSKRAQDKGIKSAYLNAQWLVVLALFLTTFLLIDVSQMLLLWLARIFLAILLFGLVVGFILPTPAISELVDEAPENILTKMKADSLSGSYFGTYFFIINVGFALGDLILGAILFGPRAENRIAVGLILPIAGFLYLGANLLFRKIKFK